MEDVKIKREPGTEDADDEDSPYSLQQLRQADPATEPEWIPEWESTTSESSDGEDDEQEDTDTNGATARSSTRRHRRPEYKIACILKRKAGCPLYGLAACRGGEPYDRYFATAGGKEVRLPHATGGVAVVIGILTTSFSPVCAGYCSSRYFAIEAARSMPFKCIVTRLCVHPPSVRSVRSPSAQR